MLCPPVVSQHSLSPLLGGCPARGGFSGAGMAPPHEETTQQVGPAAPVPLPMFVVQLGNVDSGSQGNTPSTPSLWVTWLQREMLGFSVSTPFPRLGSTGSRSVGRRTTLCGVSHLLHPSPKRLAVNIFSSSAPALHLSDWFDWCLHSCFHTYGRSSVGVNCWGPTLQQGTWWYSMRGFG